MQPYFIKSLQFIIFAPKSLLCILLPAYGYNYNLSVPTNMDIAQQKENKLDKYLKILAWLIILLGIVLRLVVYFQNRNLIIDESNIARNLYERRFIGLAKPLNYEQYAPPVFLWMLKLSSVLFGFSEYALRIYPMLCGIAALFVFYSLLKEFMSHKVLWYPLFLFATAEIFVRYSSELKQYMPDVLIVCSLLLLALRKDIFTMRAGRFTLLWIIVGTIAIWSSMPSIFALAAVGIYYSWQCFKRKDWKLFGRVVLIGSIWVLQFAFYYFAILRDQANSKYLQDFHKNDFLFATPANVPEWMHNWAVVSNLFRQFGNGDLPILFNFCMFLLAIIIFIRKDLQRGLLVITPVALMLIAAALKQYTLMARVAMFSLPLLLLAIGYALDMLLNIKKTAVRVVLLILMIAFAYNANKISMVWHRFKNEELTTAIRIVEKEGIPGNDVYFYHSSRPALIYYTQINPDSSRWKDMKNATPLYWYTNYDSLGWGIRDIEGVRRPVAFIFTNATDAEVKERTTGLDDHLQLVKKYEESYFYRVYIYKPKEHEEGDPK